MQRILIAVVMGITMLILTGFCFFAAFYYCDDSKPERILLTVIGCIAALISVLVVIGLMTC